MRTSLLIFVLLLSSYCSVSNCRYGWLVTWPKTEKINLNSIFIIEGSFLDNSLLKLNTKYPVYLKSKRDTVSLKIIKTNIGEVFWTQVVLVPIRKLKPKTTYELVIDSLSYLDFSRWNGEKNFPTKWTTTSVVDSIAPVFLEKPIFISKSYYPNGSGLDSYVCVLTKTYDMSACLIKVKVTNPNTTTKTEFLIVPKNDTIIAVGSGRCSGAFALNKEGDYAISFEIVDGSGNSSGIIDNQLYFVRPKEK